MIRAAILTSARSGSNLLVSLLNSHPEFLFHGEVFNKHKVHTFRPSHIMSQLLDIDATELRNRDPVRFLETIYALSPTHLTTIGFKMFLTHHAGVLNRMMQQDDMRIVFHERRNRLASYSSMMIAAATGVYWMKGEDADGAAKEKIRISFDSDDFDRYVGMLDDWYAAAEERLIARGNFLRTEYAELQSPETLHALAEFLGAQTRFEMKPAIVKQNHSNPLDRFDNPEAAVAHMERIGRTEWLGEG
jgi:LPS sulfotransferase NodH